jgi:hypothetical protein
MKSAYFMFLHWVVIGILLVYIAYQYTELNKLRDQCENSIYSPFLHGLHDNTTRSASRNRSTANTNVAIYSPNILSKDLLNHVSTTFDGDTSLSNIEKASKTGKYKGVAVTTFLGAPKWFQNRYSLMINQIYAMLDDDWTIQIFYDPGVKMAREGIAYPGIRRQVARGRVLLTPLPPSMKKIKKHALMLTTWFWESMVADSVLLFGGTSALCANSAHNISDFAGMYDYIGSPWNSNKGLGGEGGISFRNRSLVLSVLQEYLKSDAAGYSMQGQNNKNNKKPGKGQVQVKEDVLLVGLLAKHHGARIATKEVTLSCCYMILYFSSALTAEFCGIVLFMFFF